MEIQEILVTNGVNEYKIRHEDEMELLVDILLNEKTVHLIVSKNDMYPGYTVDVLTSKTLEKEEETILFKIAEEVKDAFFKKIRLLNVVGESDMCVNNATKLIS